MFTSPIPIYSQLPSLHAGYLVNGEREKGEDRDGMDIGKDKITQDTRRVNHK